jgi:hypothetical protein
MGTCNLLCSLQMLTIPHALLPIAYNFLFSLCNNITMVRTRLLQVVLILPASGSSSIIVLVDNCHFHESVYLEQFLETCMLFSFNARCYDWAVSKRSA